MIIVFYISLFLYIFTLAISANIVDFDFWARLAVGKTFFQTGSLLNFDFQSFGPTRQWFDHEWGASLIFYSILDNFGEVGLIVFKSILIFITYFIITRIILFRRKHKNPDAIQNPITTAPFNILFFIFLIQATLDVVFATIRCQNLSFIFFMIWFYALEKSRLENNYKILWLLPVSMIIWSNIHGGCFTGLGLLALYTIGEFLNKKPYKPYIITGLLSVAAMFINPYGIKYVYFLFYAITLKRPAITEWVSIFHEIHMFSFFKYKLWAFAIAIITGFYLTKKYNKANGDDFKNKIISLYNSLDKTKALILVIMFLLSLKTLRIMPFFAFSAAVFLYDDVYKIFNKKLPNKINNLKEILLCILLLLSFTYTIKTNKIETSVSSYPYSEVEFLKINNLKGNLFANFHYGSFLAYKLYPNNFIFMDGRYEETYEPKLLEKMRAIYTGKNWKEEFYKQHIDYIILEKTFGTFFTALLNDGWKPVMSSRNFVLLIRKDIELKNPKIPSSDFKYYQKHKWDTNINWGMNEK